MLRTAKSIMFSITILLVVGITSSCQKEISDEFAQGTNNNNNNNNNNNCKACNYYPFCDGTTYTYVDTTTGGATSSTTSTLALVGDTTVDGKTFQKASIGAGSPISYHNCTSGVTTLFGFPQPGNRVTTTILKTSEPVNATWTDLNTNAGQDFSYIWKVIDKSQTKTVLGNTYTDVIQMHLTLSVDFMGTTFIFAESDYYYAPNVGLIDNITYDWTSGAPVLAMHRVLQSYHIP